MAHIGQAGPDRSVSLCQKPSMTSLSQTPGKMQSFGFYYDFELGPSTPCRSRIGFRGITSGRLEHSYRHSADGYLLPDETLGYVAQKIIRTGRYLINVE